MPLSTILQLYRGGQFYKYKKPKYPEKTNYHGIGRHSQKDVLDILDCDLRSLSDFIGMYL
jgi:hypothetical protein